METATLKVTDAAGPTTNGTSSTGADTGAGQEPQSQDPTTITPVVLPTVRSSEP